MTRNHFLDVGVKIVTTLSLMMDFLTSAQKTIAHHPIRKPPCLCSFSSPSFLTYARGGAVHACPEKVVPLSRRAGSSRPFTAALDVLHAAAARLVAPPRELGAATRGHTLRSSCANHKTRSSELSSPCTVDRRCKGSAV